MGRRGSQTRAEIRDAALALFTERGYESTSMREIAEQLTITKAALYYHFESKEAIIVSLFEESLQALDTLLDWAEEQPQSPELSAELLNRWLALSADGGLKNMRFSAANQTALRAAFPDGRGGTLERLERAVRIILGPDAPLPDQLLVRTALLSVHTTVLAARNTQADDADILTAALHTASLLTRDLFPVAPASDASGGLG